ncbi:MAG: sigma-70 family RNA polymerase sigma factor [Planctomycetes bacterium]|nr:sigma-70 family RNA polymerase sigma factor [Planctomycetota bacterium]
MSDFATQILAARGGDSGALDSLFERHLPPLIAFIRARSGPALLARESAIDVAQSVCRELLLDAEHIELRDEGAFRNWLMMAAMRKVYDRAKALKRQRRDVARERPLPNVGPEADAILAALPNATPSQYAIANEQLERIETALLELPDDQREAVAMSRLLQLDYAQIAEQMGRTESAVRGLVARGLLAIAERL